MKASARFLWAALLCLAPAQRAAAAADNPILMPPFLVEEQKSGGQPWLYGSGGSFQALSACSSDETARFLRQIMEQTNDLETFIPGEFLARDGLPVTFVIFPKSREQEMDKTVARELGQGTAPSSGQFTPMNDLRLSEPDSTYIFIVFDDTAAMPDHWSPGFVQTHSLEYPTPVSSPSYVRFLLQAHAPALPDWYVSGCVRLYESMAFKAAGGPPAPSLEPRAVEPGGVGFGADPWLSDADASALARRPDGARPLVPMGELFAARYPVLKSEEYRRVWEAQAELFVRWALSGQVDGGPERLQRFVEGAAAQRSTEQFFYTCFGIDYADGLDALSDYLPHAVGRPVFVPAGAGRTIQTPDLRGASEAEVRRVKSEWSRRVLGAIKEDNPGAFPLFEGKIRNSIESAFSRGERDPDFLASLALFRIQYGIPGDGTRLLEQYPAAAAARPVAALELAQQHLLDALAHPAGPKGALSEEQASGIFREISQALRPGPIESAYRLAAKVCEHLGRDPSATERGILTEGARLFPRNSKLVVQAAAWELRAGRAADAVRLIEFGLWEGSDPAGREKLVVLDNLARQVLTVASLQGGNR